MCRFYFYVSKESSVSLEYVIKDAFNSLLKQSTNPAYLPFIDENDETSQRNMRFNVDGHGIIFDDGKMVKVRSKYAIGDNMQEVDNVIYDKFSTYIFAFIRHNTCKSRRQNSYLDVQPFMFGNFIFMHNGGFENQFSTLREKLIREIDIEILKNIVLNLDSKILFALVLSKVNLNDDVPQIIEQIKKVIWILERSSESGKHISTNFVLSNRELDTHIALRYRTAWQEPPSLYYKIDKGFAISSEPIDKDEKWKLLSKQLLIIKKNKCYICGLL
jgi:predicted glutamine amidotransferase